MLPELIAARVSSLKIEGRMKSAEYVASVVEAYRMVLDADEGSANLSWHPPKRSSNTRLAAPPQRGSSPHSSRMISPTLGRRVAPAALSVQIKSISGKRLSFETRDTLHVRRPSPRATKERYAGQAWTVRELFSKRSKIMSVKGGTLVEVRHRSASLSATPSTRSPHGRHSP